MSPCRSRPSGCTLSTGRPGRSSSGGSPGRGGSASGCSPSAWSPCTPRTRSGGSARGPKDGVKYFEPAATRTADGKFINADTLMMDEYCMKCHADIYNDHFHSAHKFSSFNNPAYLFSVRETRKVAKERDGNVKASRWCAGCHDPVPFFSGAFDNPNYDDVQRPDGPRRHHLHRLPRDHRPPRHGRQRRLHHRGAGPLPVRQEQEPVPAVDQQPARQGASRTSTSRRS